MKNNNVKNLIIFLGTGLICGTVMTCSPALDWSTWNGSSSCQEMIPQGNVDSEEYDEGISPLNDDSSFNDPKQ